MTYFPSFNIHTTHYLSTKITFLTEQTTVEQT